MPSPYQRYYLIGSDIKPCCPKKVESALQAYRYQNLHIHAGYLVVDIDTDGKSILSPLPNGWRVTSSMDEVPALRKKQQGVLLMRAVVIGILALVIAVLEMQRASLLAWVYAPQLFFLIGGASLLVIAYGVYWSIQQAQRAWQSGGAMFDGALALMITTLFALCVMTMHGAIVTGCVVCLSHFQCTLWLLGSLQFREWLRLALPAFLEPEVLPPRVVVGSDMAVGTEFTVKPGQQLGCVGRLQNQCADFNCVLSTGDTHRQGFAENASVPYGAIYLGDKSIKLQVEKVISHHASDIQEAIEARAVSRQKSASHILVIMTLVVLGIGVTVPAIWFFAVPGFGVVATVNMMLSVFLVACPCALSLVQPLIYSIASARAQAALLSVRDNSVWARLLAMDPQQVDFCWDRTNTLTDPATAQAATPRAEVQVVIEGLKQMGYRNHYILSGTQVDQPWIGFTDGIWADKQAGLTAEEKRNFVLARQKLGRQVVMIGDGDNDMLALLAADIAVAMCHGAGDKSQQCSFMPTAHADMTLDNHLQGLLMAMRMVAAVRPIQSMVLGGNLLYNTVGIMMAAGGLWWLTGIAFSASWASWAMCFSMSISLLGAYVGTHQAINAVDKVGETTHSTQCAQKSCLPLIFCCDKNKDISIACKKNG
jgi:cation transport ATPase